jgi:hypothetical protein
MKFNAIEKEKNCAIIEVSCKEVVVLANTIVNLGMDIDEFEYSSIIGATPDEIKKLYNELKDICLCMKNHGMY